MRTHKFRDGMRKSILSFIFIALALVIAAFMFSPAVHALAPEGLTATYSNGNVTLSWNPVTNATLYKIYRGNSSGNESYYANTTNTTYIDTNVTVGHTYYYYVTAVVNGNETNKSQEVYITIESTSGGGVIEIHHYLFNVYLLGFGVLLVVFSLPLWLYGARNHKDIAKFGLIGGFILIGVSWILAQTGYALPATLTLFGVALNGILLFIGAVFFIIGVALIVSRDYDRHLVEGHLDVARFSIAVGVFALLMAYLVSLL